MNKRSIEEAAKAERLEYFRQWRANNKEKVRQHNKTYWEKKARERLKGGEINGK